VEKLEKITPPEEVLLLARTQRKPKEFGRGPRGSAHSKRTKTHWGLLGLSWFTMFFSTEVEIYTKNADLSSLYEPRTMNHDQKSDTTHPQ
jgi:hypothetical protein